MSYTKIYTLYCREDHKNLLRFELEHEVFNKLSFEITNKFGLKTCGFSLLEDENEESVLYPLTDATPIYFKYFKYEVEIETDKYAYGLDEFVQNKLNQIFDGFCGKTFDTFENFMEVLKGAQDFYKYIEPETAFIIISYYYNEYDKPNKKIVSKLTQMSLCDLVSHDYLYGSFMNYSDYDFFYQVPTKYAFSDETHKLWKNFESRFFDDDNLAADEVMGIEVNGKCEFWLCLDDLEWFVGVVINYFENKEEFLI